jgi:tRNA (guanine-N7-)-methyltransferase
VGKNKLMRFAEVEELPNVIQPNFNHVFYDSFEGKGKWHQHFGNDNPVVIELGCGKGEYTVGLARMYPGKNFVGVDIKGARIWRGAKTAFHEGLKNVVFVRTRIEFVHAIFNSHEVSEIWLTFPDPQLKKRRTKKRLTSSNFLINYQKILKPSGFIHLKTDNTELYHYTKKVIELNKLYVEIDTDHLYNSEYVDEILNIQTFYEKRFLAEGMPIHYLKFQLPTNSNILEPPNDEE